MPTLTIRNVPEELHHRLKARAARHHRSMNSEVIACLESLLGSKPVDPEEFLTRARALREKASGVFVTEEDLRQAKREGRL